MDDLAPAGTVTLAEFEAETEALLTPPPALTRFRAVFAHDLAKLAVTRDWLVKERILARSFTLVLGARGCGKSFLVLDYAMTAARAAVDTTAPAQWFGKRLAPTGVIYLAAEGQDDFVFRIRAWLEAKGLATDMRIPFILIPTALHLGQDSTDVADLVAEIAQAKALCARDFGVDVGAIVVDTVNRVLNGGNENDSAVMGSFVKNCDRIRQEAGISVIGVHHLPEAREQATKPRGHGSLAGATDAEIVVTGPADGAPNSFRVTRLKSGPAGERREFRLRQHRLGEDEDGDALTSCVVTELGGEESAALYEMRDAAPSTKGEARMTPDGRAILGDNLTIALNALARAISADGRIDPAVKAPHGRHVVTMKRWLDEMVAIMPGEDKDLKFRDRCRKARDAAAIKFTNRGIIGIEGEHVWRTERRVFGVDAALVSEKPRPVSGSDAGLSELSFDNVPL